MKPGLAVTQRVGEAWRAACIDHARRTFSKPPAFDHIARPQPRGDLVATFVLPLELLPTTNLTRGTTKWQAKKRKNQIMQLYGVASRFKDYRHREPLEGRPQVLCTRFSAREPDKYSDWAKSAVDALCVPKIGKDGKALGWGLGYLRDDNPRSIDLVQWWEPAAPGEGFGLIRVFRG